MAAPFPILRIRKSLKRKLSHLYICYKPIYYQIIIKALSRTLYVWLELPESPKHVLIVIGLQLRKQLTFTFTSVVVLFITFVTITFVRSWAVVAVCVGTTTNSVVLCAFINIYMYVHHRRNKITRDVNIGEQQITKLSIYILQ